jgi:hypothetical protein
LSWACVAAHYRQDWRVDKARKIKPGKPKTVGNNTRLRGPRDRNRDEAASSAIEVLNERWHRALHRLASLLVDGFHDIGLFAIDTATAWAAG